MGALADKSTLRMAGMHDGNTSTEPAENGEPKSAKDTNNDDSRFNFDGRKPLHYTQSAPSFRDERLLLDGRRSRSQSEPLTRDAVKIAMELRRASDLFNTNYLSSPVRKSFAKTREKSRRITVAGADGESLRQEVNEAMKANIDSFYRHNPISPEGTPV